ncbi:hypothetical protein FOA52_007366 [Chlamydomonas sp. UWO 241]|nr:hypothetical protein FOA52_007366 [Chlamydomonas sp. UWO 241]
MRRWVHQTEVADSSEPPVSFALEARLTKQEAALQTVLNRLDKLEIAHAKGLHEGLLGGRAHHGTSPTRSFPHGNGSIADDDMSAYSVATTGISMPAPFLEQLHAAKAGHTRGGNDGTGSDATMGTWHHSILGGGRASCTDGGSGGGVMSMECSADRMLSAGAMAAVVAQAGTDPLPWIQLLLQGATRDQPDAARRAGAGTHTGAGAAVREGALPAEHAVDLAGAAAAGREASKEGACGADTDTDTAPGGGGSRDQGSAPSLSHVTAAVRVLWPGFGGGGGGGAAGGSSGESEGPAKRQQYGAPAASSGACDAAATAEGAAPAEASSHSAAASSPAASAPSSGGASSASGGNGSLACAVACLVLAAQSRTDERMRAVVWAHPDAVATAARMLSLPPGGPRKAAAFLLWHLSRAADLPRLVTSPGLAQMAPQLVGALVGACWGSKGGSSGSSGGGEGGGAGVAETDVYTTKAAALALSNLNQASDHLHRLIVDARGPAALVDMLRASDGVGQEAAATALMALTAGDDDACGDVLAVRGVQVLVSLMRYGDPGVQESAAGVLQNVSCCDGSECDLVAAGAVPVLLELMREGSEEAQACAVATLGNLAACEGAHQALASSGAVAALSAAFHAACGSGVTAAHSTPRDPRAEARARAALAEGAVTALVNMASGSSATRRALLAAGGGGALLAAARGSCGGGGGGLTPATGAAASSPAASSPAPGNACAASGGGDGGDGDGSDGSATALQLRLPPGVQVSALCGVLALSAEPSLAGELMRCGAAAVLLQVALARGGGGGGGEAAGSGVSRAQARARELAAKALTNLSIPDGGKASLCDAGAAPVLTSLLRTGCRACRHAAARCVMNLARCSSARKELADAGVAAVLLRLLAVAATHGGGGSGGARDTDTTADTSAPCSAAAIAAAAAASAPKPAPRPAPAGGGMDLPLVEAAAGALYNMLSSRSAAGQVVRCGGVVQLGRAAVSAPPGSRASKLLGAMIGLWVAFGMRAYNGTSDGLKLLSITATDVDRAQPAVIATAVVFLVILLCVAIVSFWRSFVEASHDATGMSGGAATAYLVINALVSTCWWLITVFLTVMVAFTSIWYWVVYLLQGSIQTSIDVTAAASLLPVAWIPSSGLPCPSQCYDLTEFVFLDSSFANSCTCDKATLTVAVDTFQKAQSDLLPATIGIFILTASAIALALNLASQFSHTKREKECIRRATSKQFEGVI